jgi:hypothetical protein
MQPFDLQKALLGEPLVYGYGEEVVDLKQFANGELISLAKNGTYRRHKLDGTTIVAIPSYEAEFSLFMAEKPKVKKEGWINVWKDKYIFTKNYVGSIFETKEDAENQVKLWHRKSATIKIEWEEEAN